MLRRFFQLKSWPFLVAVLFIGGGALAVLGTRSGAAVPSLWSDTPPTLASGQTSGVAVAKADTAAVVNISTTQVVKNPMALDNQGNPNDPFQEFFRQFMGNMLGPTGRTVSDRGSSSGRTATSSPITTWWMEPRRSRSSSRAAAISRRRSWVAIQRPTWRS